MTKVQIRYFVMFALLVGSRLPSTAQAQQPLSAIFQNLPTADDGDDIWSQAAQAQSTAGPKYTSTAIEMKTFEGIFIPTSNDVELWVFSDDGVDVQVKLGGLPDPPPGDPVQLSNKGNPQHLPTQAQSLHKVPFSFVANQCYGVRVEYQNIIDNGVSDVDGCTLFAIKDDAEVLEVDLDASNVDDDDEEDPGAFVGVNNDDDNDNQTPDKDEDPVSGEDDLLPLALDYMPAVSSGTLTLDVTAGGSKVEIWDSANKGTQLTLPKAWDLSSETPPTTVYLEGVAASASARDVTVELKLETCSNEETDIVKVTVVEVDLDIDSDNNGTIQAADDPIEDDASEPGKYVVANVGDDDDDGIVNFADGFDLDDTASNDDDQSIGVQFVPVVLTISDAVEVNTATIKFTYDDSDPAGVTEAGGVYTAASGDLRIWKEDSATARDKAAANAAMDPGDYIPSGEYTPSQLGLSGGQRTVTLYLEGITPSTALGAERILVEVDPDGAGPAGFMADDAVRVTVVEVDLDIDSDNDNGLAAPDRDAAEDQIEDISSEPGKYVVANVEDKDDDGIVDFADGFDLDDTASNDDDQSTGVQFVPLVLEVQQPIDMSAAKIKFTYDESDPAGVNESGGVYTAAAGELRIWKEDGGVARDKAAANAAMDPGDYVPSGEYTPGQLDLSGGQRTVTLYLEGIKPSTALGAERIRVEVDPDGVGPAGFMVDDAVRVTVVEVDLDIDSDNDDGFGAPEQNAAEDQIEDDASKPGKYVAANIGDEDDDGIVDFADGFDLDDTASNDDDQSTGVQFVPLVLEVQQPIDMSVAKIKFTYDESDPVGVNESGGVYTAAAGELRIWKEDGGVARDKAAANAAMDPGDYVPSGVYTPGQLDLSGGQRSVTLYVEGITKSTSIGGERILVEVDPDGDGPVGFVADDAVRVTVIEVDLDVDTDRNNSITQLDEEEEDAWSKGPDSRGAIILPNADKDNTTEGAPDNWIGGDWDLDGTPDADEAANQLVDNNGDIDDIGELWANKLGPGTLADNMTITLRVAKPGAEHSFFSGVDAEDRIRIFLPTDDTTEAGNALIQVGDEAIIGPEDVAEVEFVKTPTGSQEDYDIFAGNGIVKFGIEGIEVGAMVDVTLTVTLGATTLASDTVRVRVAPYVLNNHTELVNTGGGVGDTAYITDPPFAFDNADVIAKLKTLVGAAHVDEAAISDVWQQDGYEVGYVKAPSGEMPAVFISPRAQRSSNILMKYVHNSLLIKDVGVIWKLENEGGRSDKDSLGNMESRPAGGEPGTFFHGNGMLAEITDFFEAQDVNPEVEVNTDWLNVGHVDEVISFASNGTNVVVADPEVCWALLIWADQIDGTATMLEDMDPHGAGGTTVGDVISETAIAGLRAFNLEPSGAGSHVMKPANLPSIRSDLSLSSPESTPMPGGGNTGDLVLNKGGALIGFFPGSPPKKRYFRITFTSATEYKLEYQEEGAGSWTLDRTGANLANDEVFTDALCFVFRHWWDDSIGGPDVDDTFEFSADPASDTIEMPVIFKDSFGAALNYTNNHVNCVVHDVKVLTAKSWGPSVDYTGGGASSILGDYVDKMFGLAGYTTIITADDREYSNGCGSVHCGTNVQRTIPTFDWWEN